MRLQLKQASPDTKGRFRLFQNDAPAAVVSSSLLLGQRRRNKDIPASFSLISPYIHQILQHPSPQIPIFSIPFPGESDFSITHLPEKCYRFLHPSARNRFLSPTHIAESCVCTLPPSNHRLPEKHVSGWLRRVAKKNPSSSQNPMARRRFQPIEDKNHGFFSNPEMGFQWNLQEGRFSAGGLFASVSQVGVGFGTSPSPPSSEEDSGKMAGTDLLVKYVLTPEFGVRTAGISGEAAVAGEQVLKKWGGLNIKVRIGNPSLRRLVSGAVAGAVSRTATAPLETIRTHLMVGSNGHSTTEVFQNIMKTEGWTGLFRGNFVNVIRVAPNKAVELFAYDTIKKNLSSQPGEPPKIPIPPSLVAGACAGLSSTVLTYPLELLKTRLTIQRGVYDNLLHAFLKIVREEGPTELYRGLASSIIGVVPYAAANYFAYDTLQKAYRKVFKEEEIGNIATLLIGSAAGAISSSATFPLEVARKRMQVGAVGGRCVYDNLLHALVSILEKEGLPGLYRGLGPSCMKLVPAAGISFMCYEALKRILIQREDKE